MKKSFIAQISSLFLISAFLFSSTMSLALIEKTVLDQSQVDTSKTPVDNKAVTDVVLSGAVEKVLPQQTVRPQKTWTDFFNEPIYEMPLLRTLHAKICKSMGIEDLRTTVQNCHKTFNKENQWIVRPWANLGVNCLTKADVAYFVAISVASHCCQKGSWNALATESGIKIARYGLVSFALESAILGAAFVGYCSAYFVGNKVWNFVTKNNQSSVVRPELPKELPLTPVLPAISVSLDTNTVVAALPLVSKSTALKRIMGKISWLVGSNVMSLYINDWICQAINDALTTLAEAHTASRETEKKSVDVKTAVGQEVDQAKVAAA